jgi:predicted MFS family arabinose efflux permease
MPAADGSGAGKVFFTGQRETALLAVLLFGNFAVGTGILLPAAMLNELSLGLSISLADAGALILVSGLVCAAGAPIAAAATSSIDRRTLLVTTVLIALAANAASAAANSLVTLNVARIGVAIAAAIFTPQAASALGVLLPPERRGRGITMIFVGWSLATVCGMPLGHMIAEAAGWRAAYAALSALLLIAAYAVWAVIPGGVLVPRLNSASWRLVLTSPALMLILLVTALNGTGHFTHFTYLTPSLTRSLASGGTVVTLILAWWGLAATFGNVAAAYLVRRMGPARASIVTLSLMVTGLALWGLADHSLVGVVAASAVWGAGTFATMSIQQARLAAAAPDLTSASIALNTSAIYLGHAAGATLGGALITSGQMAQLSFVGSAILLTAVAVSVLAMRWERR